VIDYKDAKIQLLDLPGIIEGAAKGNHHFSNATIVHGYQLGDSMMDDMITGRGRGKQVIGVARTSDMVLMMLEAEKADIQRELLTYVRASQIPSLHLTVVRGPERE
jgi:ribosome-interacting GTPase 1